MAKTFTSNSTNGEVEILIDPVPGFTTVIYQVGAVVRWPAITATQLLCGITFDGAMSPVAVAEFRAPGDPVMLGHAFPQGIACAAGQVSIIFSSMDATGNVMAPASGTMSGWVLYEYVSA